MTSVIALQDAFREAVAEGATDFNLNIHTFNAEPEENLLDALDDALNADSDAEASLFFVATDAAFKEAPTTLNQGIAIRSTYQDILNRLTAREARIHAFTASAVDGITRPFNHIPPLTSLPGSTVHQLEDLQGANDRIKETLEYIAQDAACH